MKKVLLVLMMVGSYAVTQAQTTAGSMMIGGGFSLSSNTTETTGDDLKSSSFSLVPTFGYFLKDNVAIGVDLGLYTDTYTNDDKETSIGFAPYARFYKFLVEDKLAIYGQGGIGFASGKYDPDGGNESNSGSFGVYVRPGFSYFFNQKWALDFQLAGISYTSYDPDKDADDDKEKSFVFGASSFNPSLGFRYFISK